jgi:hypothetical protein
MKKGPITLNKNMGFPHVHGIDDDSDKLMMKMMMMMRKTIAMTMTLEVGHIVGRR